ncbi:hypothetical protein ACFE04_029964 [Oxalis oulophora]
MRGGGGGGGKLHEDDDEYDDERNNINININSTTTPNNQDGSKIHNNNNNNKNTVIEYVQFLQDKVQKYETPYQGCWNSEPMKLMPWRNSHWRVQNFAQTIKDDSETGPAYIPGKHDDNNVTTAPAMLSSEQHIVQSDPRRSSATKVLDQQPELANNGGLSLPMALQTNMFPPIQHDGGLVHHPVHTSVMSDRQSAECQVSGESLNEHEELAIEGGTISISSVYSQGLLNNLTHALQSAGVDLSQANVSVQIDVGKRANRGLASGTSTSKDTENPHTSNQTMAQLRGMGRGEDSEQAQKRHKT